ncbi:hypothetical protein ASE01_02800 [Nocardioides sp. Root190]|uniref:cytochrome P450 n=1 Tax=Nocardioides sp. Root190 TaxID=1736488 RepID=UPI0006FFC145|nr:cytochrome P450 [Nocardioides sp. Root190]KRB80419.1 hypothetical protein ASE01_02800 [Nocardioides sp. Root190]
MDTETQHDIPLDEVDFNDLSFFESGPPHVIFARMRAEAPVLWNRPTHDNDGFWSLSRHADDVAVTSDWETFSSARRGIFLREEGILPKEFTSNVFSMMDPPDHGKQRGILAKVFTPKAVMAREPHIRAVFNSAVDQIIDRGSCDLVDDIGVRFPLAVISDMLGVPESDQHLLFKWTNTMADTHGTPEEGMTMMGELAAYLVSLIAEKRTNPTDDLLSRLLEADVEGRKLDDMEVILHFAQLMAGGNETTRNAFSGGVLALLENPDQLQALRNDPGLINSAVEEILRWHTPIMHNARTATRDVEIAGTKISEGERVAMWRSSSNRDASVFDDADRFLIDRRNNKHFTFSGGPHYCLGNQLARLELRICILELLQRMPDLALAGEAERVPNNSFHWMKKVPVSFTPGTRSPQTV